MTIWSFLPGAWAGAADAPSAGSALAARYGDFILAAGNADVDAVRLAHLKKLAYQCTVDGTTLAGLDGLIKLVTESMRTWVDAAARAERGKPAGILPTAIHSGRRPFTGVWGIQIS